MIVMLITLWNLDLSLLYLVVYLFFIFISVSLTGNHTGSKPTNEGSLTVLGLHLTMLPFTKMSFFTDKKEVQKFATAIGYVAHVCSSLCSTLYNQFLHLFHYCSVAYIMDCLKNCHPSFYFRTIKHGLVVLLFMQKRLYFLVAM